MKRYYPCHNIEYVGKEFGDWKVIALVDGNGWMCQCIKCGRKAMRNGNKVLCGNAEKCLCKREEEKYKMKFPVGTKIGHLTTIGEYNQEEGTILCKCDCGNICKKSVNYLKERRNRQNAYCGRNCEYIKMNNMNYGYTNKRILGIWHCMRSRCYSIKNPKYKDWGGRGITICDEWLHSYKSFEDWALSHGYRDDLSIDRIDNDGNYCPENCRWATVKEQNENKRPPVRPKHNKTRKNVFTLNGETKSLVEWCEEKGVLVQTVTYRMKKKGMDFETALTAEKETTGRPFKKCS